MSKHLSFLAELSGFEFGLIVATLSSLTSLALVALILYAQHRRRALWHETARLALEKGQPIPGADPDSTTGSAPADPQTRVRGYLIGGITNIAVAAGMYIAFRHFVPLVAYVAAVPACIGVSMLLGGWVEHRSAQKTGK
ncbi:MAG TPA: DUF6249 domain-containing protein [Candidatus Synoicihabitans sp.]|nr:DUF6249 domain-containing protein [Candidatus Synoicihabitans sp.]